MVVHYGSSTCILQKREGKRTEEREGGKDRRKEEDRLTSKQESERGTDRRTNKHL